MMGHSSIDYTSDFLTMARRKERCYSCCKYRYHRVWAALCGLFIRAL